MFRVAIALSLLVPLTGCAIIYESMLETQSQMAANMWAPQLDAARQGATASPGAYAPAAQFAYAVVGYVNSGACPAEEKAALIPEAEGYLTASAQAEPATAWGAWNDVGNLRRANGDHAGAIEAFQTSQGKKANVGALDPWFDSLRQTGDSVSSTCAGLRPSLKGEDQIVALMVSCERNGDPMAWASPSDQRLLADAKAAAAEREAQRQAEEAARAAAYASSSSSSSYSRGSSSSSSSAPSGPVMVSVSLKNGCSETVRLFFGDKPKYGSGRYSSLGSNNITSERLQEGDMIWLVDSSDNGLASYTASTGASSVEVNSSCSGFIVR
ncbi:MAG: hypothetical protein H6741_13410 [Alphaproteobacteria bacterium]|nr:hypothetical protein [Alphaproteobacteria bacterium]